MQYGQPPTTRVVRVEFTPNEAHILDRARGTLSRAVYVRGLLLGALDLARLPPAQPPYDQTRTARSVRLAFRMRLDDLRVVDKNRHGIPRSAWIREVALRSVKLVEKLPEARPPIASTPPTAEPTAT